MWGYEGFFFLTGLVSSAHCIGMCGTFAAALVSGSDSPVKMQIMIASGRFLSYIAIGAIAGGAGSLFFYNTLTAKLLLGAFAILAASYGFLLMSGKSFSTPPLFKKKISTLIPVKTTLKAFTVGLIIPALPCPILHAAVSFTILSGGRSNGALAMAFFAAGTTLPVFLSSVFFERALKKTGGYHIKAAGGIILLSSLLSLGRLGGGNMVEKYSSLLR